MICQRHWRAWRSGRRAKSSDGLGPTRHGHFLPGFRGMICAQGLGERDESNQDGMACARPRRYGMGIRYRLPVRCVAVKAFQSDESPTRHEHLPPDNGQSARPRQHGICICYRIPIDLQDFANMNVCYRIPDEWLLRGSSLRTRQHGMGVSHRTPVRCLDLKQFFQLAKFYRRARLQSALFRPVLSCPALSCLSVRLSVRKVQYEPILSQEV